MKTSVNKPIVLGLLLGLAGGSTVAARADDKTTDKSTDKTTVAAKKTFQPTQQKLTGKVVAVDRVTKSVTIQINGQTYVLQLNDATKISQAGTPKSIMDVTVGQDVTVDVMLKESTGGKIEVAVLSVDLPSTETAQGKPAGAGTFRPFQGTPNPGNIDGSIVSPTTPGKTKSNPSL